MVRGGILSRDTAIQLSEAITTLRSRLAAAEAKIEQLKPGAWRDDMFIAIPQDEIAAATVTPTLITPASGMCDLFHWSGAVLKKRGEKKVFNFRAETIPALEPIAISRETTGGRLFALRPASGEGGGGGGIEFDCGAVFDPDDDLTICTGLALDGKVQLFLDRDSLTEMAGEFALVYTPAFGWSLMPIVGCE